jgi:hypothetical protein
LKKYGKIYGCNALYRSFAPDVLIATDPGISAEIQQSGYALKNVFYTRKPLPNLGAEPIKYHYGYSSGPVALAYASHSDAELIYMLGFDLAGIKGKFNNIYANTTYYKKTNDAETFYGNWVDQITHITKANSQRQYIRVIGQNGVIPAAFNQIKNLSHVPVDQFCSSYK